MSDLDEPRDAQWKAAIARLDAAYQKLGHAGLSLMFGVEPLALWNEKVRDWKLLQRHLESHPDDATAKANSDRLVIEANDIGAWIKRKLREQNRAVERDLAKGRGR